MSHFYEITPGGNAKLLASVTTMSQARKYESLAVPSITTKISYFPKGMMQAWREKRIFELAQTCATYEEASEKAWGMRKCPNTGEQITSSDFGTAGHDRLEKVCLAMRDGYGWKDMGNDGYDKWVDLWIDWLDLNGATVIDCELQVGDYERKTSGMIDFIGKKGGKVFIADYKFRDARDLAHLKRKAYRDKDDMQLAWAADVIRQRYDLGYMPEIYTVLMNSTDPQMHVHKWTEAAQAKALARFDILNTFVNGIEGLN